MKYTWIGNELQVPRVGVFKDGDPLDRELAEYLSTMGYDSFIKMEPDEVKKSVKSKPEGEPK